MAFAIMEWEGYRKGSVSYYNNNPGNIKAAKQPGLIGQDSEGHGKFLTFQDGWDALINQLTMMGDGRSQVYNAEMTLFDVFAKYAEANAKPYAEFVAKRLGVMPITRLKHLP
jgi:hypothetical protein